MYVLAIAYGETIIDVVLIIDFVQTVIIASLIGFAGIIRHSIILHVVLRICVFYKVF